MENTERIEKLLAMLLIQGMKGSKDAEKVLQLSLAGFSNVEIANLLQTSAPVVAQSLYMARKRGRSK